MDSHESKPSGVHIAAARPGWGWGWETMGVRRRKNARIPKGSGSSDDCGWAKKCGNVIMGHGNAAPRSVGDMVLGPAKGRNPLAGRRRYAAFHGVNVLRHLPLKRQATRAMPLRGVCWGGKRDFGEKIGWVVRVSPRNPRRLTGI